MIMKNRTDLEQESLELLFRQGFSYRQIRRFCQLHQTYGQDEMDQPALDKRRLEFARLLVATGRLTEEK
jgi:hypothetical protein